jgi:hypothetical protein
LQLFRRSRIALLFFKLTEYIIRRWTFDVGRLLVSFSIKQAALKASGGAEH